MRGACSIPVTANSDDRVTDCMAEKSGSPGKELWKHPALNHGFLAAAFTYNTSTMIYYEFNSYYDDIQLRSRSLASETLSIFPGTADCILPRVPLAPGLTAPDA